MISFFLSTALRSGGAQELRPDRGAAGGDYVAASPALRAGFSTERGGPPPDRKT